MRRKAIWCCIMAFSTIVLNTAIAQAGSPSLTSGFPSGYECNSDLQCDSDICYYDPNGPPSETGICSDCAEDDCTDKPDIIQWACRLIDCEKSGTVECGTVQLVIKGVGVTRKCFFDT